MATASKTSVHDFTVEDARGNDVDLSIYKGKVLLIVNVASQCGLTNSNYTELAQLYAKYKDQGFEILAFPCNQFGSQEPGTNEEIVQFACTRFKAEYPIFNKCGCSKDERHTEGSKECLSLKQHGLPVSAVVKQKAWILDNDNNSLIAH